MQIGAIPGDVKIVGNAREECLMTSLFLSYPIGILSYPILSYIRYLRGITSPSLCKTTVRQRSASMPPVGTIPHKIRDNELTICRHHPPSASLTGARESRVQPRVPNSHPPHDFSCRRRHRNRTRRVMISMRMSLHLLPRCRDQDGEPARLNRRRVATRSLRTLRITYPRMLDSMLWKTIPLARTLGVTHHAGNGTLMPISKCCLGLRQKGRRGDAFH